MNSKEVDALVNLALEELSTAQTLYDSKKYRACVTHSYYAIFNFAKALLLTENFRSKKHDTIIKQFSLDFVKNNDFSRDIFQYYIDAKENRKKSSYDAFSDFNRIEAFESLTKAEDFIIEAKRILNSL